MRRSLLFSFLDRYGGAAMNALGILILARLLTPADFGIYAVAMSIVMMIDVVRDFGAGTYLVQEPQLTDSVVRSVFTVSLLLSALCMLLLVGLARPIASFYGNAELVGLMPLLGASFLLVPFGVPSIGLLQRNMEFGKLAAINLIAYATNLVVTTGLAALGFGYMSLAWATLVCSIVRTVCGIAWCPCLWAFRPVLAGWRNIVEFGSYSAASGIVNVFHDNLPQMIVGRMLGFGAVGMLGRAASVCQLPDRLFTSALKQVLLPGLAESARERGDLKFAYLHALAYMTALQWPILLCLAILANPVVTLLLGPQWLDAAPLVRIMALASLTLFPAFMTYPVLVASGAVRDTLLMSLISIPPSVFCIILASHHGLKVVAATQFITGPLQVYVALTFIRRRIHFTWGEFAAPLVRSAVIAMCAATPAALGLALAGFRLDMSTSAMCFSAFGALAGWAGGLFVTRHPLLAEVRRATSHLRWSGLRPAWLR
jgi:O-antigen/teichoic acid export membrane protein